MGRGGGAIFQLRLCGDGAPGSPGGPGQRRSKGGTGDPGGGGVCVAGGEVHRLLTLCPAALDAGAAALALAPATEP